MADLVSMFLKQWIFWLGLFIFDVISSFRPFCQMRSTIKWICLAQVCFKVFKSFKIFCCITKNKAICVTVSKYIAVASPLVILFFFSTGCSPPIWIGSWTEGQATGGANRVGGEAEAWNLPEWRLHWLSHPWLLRSRDLGTRLPLQKLLYQAEESRQSRRSSLETRQLPILRGKCCVRG